MERLIDSDFHNAVKGMIPLIQVFDMPKSLFFYCDILGFQLLHSAGPPDDIGWASLRWNEVELMLNTIYEKPQRPPFPEELRNKHHSDTALYFSCPDVDGLYNHLLKKGLTMNAPAVTQYGWKAIDIHDPDGYHLCFQWPVDKK